MGTRVSERFQEELEEALDRLRPALIADGGNVELLGVDEKGGATIVLQGACSGCPSQIATLRLLLEPALKSAVPGLQSLVLADSDVIR